MEYRWHKNEDGEYSVEKVKNRKNTALYIIVAVLFVLLITMVLVSNALVRRVKRFDFADSLVNNLPAPTVEVKDEGFLGLSERVADSIVSIPQSSAGGGFFGYMVSSGGGSGLIVSSDGYIITSVGAVEGMSTISVVMPDGTEEPANAVSMDNRTGLVVLKVNKTGLTPCQFASSENVKAGMNVAAVMRNSTYSLGTTMSIGTVASVNKNVTMQNGVAVNLFQIDSGLGGTDGAVIYDNSGKVLAITTSSISSGTEGISMAIPSNDIINIVSSFTGETTGNGIMIGITGTDSEHGVVVESVKENSSAEKAGIEKGDLIMKADGKAVKSVADINTIKETRQKGDTMVFTVLRDGEITEIKVKLG